MHKKVILALSILLLMVLPLLSACKAETPTAAPPEVVPTEKAAPPPTAVPPTAVPPTEVPPAPISITVAYPGGFTGLTSIDPSDFFGAAPPGVFESLVAQDKDDALYGLLAESWEWSDDGLTLTMKLREGVKFSTGDPFTTADVEFSLLRSLEKNMPVIAQLSPGQGYNGYEVVDDYTIKFLFTKVNVQFVPQTLVNMYMGSKTYYDQVGEDAYVKLPVGTGPYKIADWAEGQYIDLVYNENYRGEKPQIESAHFVASPDSATRVAMLQAGEVDMAAQVPGASITALEAAGFARVDIPQPHDIAMVFNLLAPDTPWQDLRVRQAINYAIDKQSLIDTMLCGPLQEGVWALPTAPWYDPSLKPAYPYDLAKAQELMEEAGYADGFTFPITYLVTEWGANLADYLASALAQINITVELTAIAGMPDFMPSIAAVHNSYVNGETVPATVGAFVYDPGWPGNPEVSIDLTNGFYMAKDNTLFDNPAINDLVDEVLSTLDDEARYEVAGQAWAAIDELLPVIPIGLEVQVNMMKPNITYVKSVGGMATGPTNLIDLRIEE